MRRAFVPFLGLVLLASSGCGFTDDCPKARDTSAMQLEVPAAVRKLVSTFQVELCQGEHCGSTDFPARPAGGGSAAEETLAPGVSLDGDNIRITLATVGKGWKAGSASGLTVTGFTRRGRVVLQHTEQFTFDASYPNGKSCAPEVLRYATGVDGADLQG